MSTLTPDQARALWDAGGFAVVTGLPRGSESGIDGSFHAVNKFAGYKFVPPGVHVVSWAAGRAGAADGGSGDGADGREAAAPGFTLRSALIHSWAARERVGVSYSASSETSAARQPPDEAELRELDPQLAAYPFGHLEAWKALTGYITPAVLTACVRDVGGLVDGLTPVVGDDDGGAGAGAGGVGEDATEGRKRKRAGDEGDTGKPTSTATTAATVATTTTVRTEEVATAAAGAASSAGLHFPRFDLRRSWPPGASGSDVSRWSQDKSMLWARLVAEYGVLGYTQLAYILVREVWSAPALGMYKRLVAVLCRSAAAIADADAVAAAARTNGDSTTGDQATSDTAATGASARGTDAAAAREAWLSWLDVLASQIGGLPAYAFMTELPGLDAFYADEIGALARGMGAALGARAWWGLAPRVGAVWRRLTAAGAKVGIHVPPLPAGDEDESDEEGEYAPVVVDDGGLSDGLAEED